MKTYKIIPIYNKFNEQINLFDIEETTYRMGGNAWSYEKHTSQIILTNATIEQSVAFIQAKKEGWLE